LRFQPLGIFGKKLFRQSIRAPFWYGQADAFFGNDQSKPARARIMHAADFDDFARRQYHGPELYRTGGFVGLQEKKHAASLAGKFHLKAKPSSRRKPGPRSPTARDIKLRTSLNNNSTKLGETAS
jgi:hypothetical protein